LLNSNYPSLVESDEAKSYLRSILDNKDIAKLLSLIATSISSIKNEVSAGVMIFEKYSFIWEKNRETALKEFLENDPQVSEFEAKLKEFNTLSNEINSYPEFIEIGAIAVETELLKSGIISEIKLWKVIILLFCLIRN
jgi:dynein heavy chain